MTYQHIEPIEGSTLKLGWGPHKRPVLIDDPDQHEWQQPGHCARRVGSTCTTLIRIPGAHYRSRLLIEATDSQTTYQEVARIMRMFAREFWPC